MLMKGWTAAHGEVAFKYRSLRRGSNFLLRELPSGPHQAFRMTHLFISLPRGLALSNPVGS